jgi:hypothetical protein
VRHQSSFGIYTKTALMAHIRVGSPENAKFLGALSKIGNPITNRSQGHHCPIRQLAESNFLAQRHLKHPDAAS